MKGNAQKIKLTVVPNNIREPKKDLKDLKDRDNGMMLGRKYESL